MLLGATCLFFHCPYWLDIAAGSWRLSPKPKRMAFVAPSALDRDAVLFAAEEASTAIFDGKRVLADVLVGEGKGWHGERGGGPEGSSCTQATNASYIW